MTHGSFLIKDSQVEKGLRRGSEIALEARDTASSAEGGRLQQGSYEFLPQDRVIFGRPAAEAVAETADRLGKNRLLVVASKTLSRQTDVVSRIREALGKRCIGLLDLRDGEFQQLLLIALTNDHPVPPDFADLTHIGDLVVQPKK